MVSRVINIVLVLAALSGLVQAEDSGGVWLDVPFVKQGKDGCGAASIAMVMQYWQLKQSRSSNHTVEQIQRALHSDAAHGIYASDMVRYFQQNGYGTFTFAGDWLDLKQHLEKGRPLI